MNSLPINTYDAHVMPKQNDEYSFSAWWVGAITNSIKAGQGGAKWTKGWY
jgi:hypothetical protein